MYRDPLARPIASACSNPSENITGTARLLQPKKKKVLYVDMENMDFLPPTAPSLSLARENEAGGS